MKKKSRNDHSWKSLNRMLEVGAAVMLIGGAAGTVLGDAGDIDLSFGTNGIVTTDLIGGTADQALDVAAQADGRIIAVGTDGNDFVVTRYNADGSLDTSFDTDGIVTTDFGGTDLANAVAIQSNGKIVVGGQTNAGGEISSVLIRYDTDGAVDSAFRSVDGPIINFLPGANDHIVDIEVLQDGDILVGVKTFGSSSTFLVARLNPDGTLDNDFGSGGVASIDVTTNGVDQVADIVRLADGSIIVAGNTSFGAKAIRLLADGTHDENFGTGGIAEPPVASILGAGVQSINGGIILGGTSGADVQAARLNIDGSLDTTFGTSGVATIDLGGTEVAFDLAVQGDDAIVLAGTQQTTSFPDVLVLRLNPDGTLDTNFGDGGATVTDINDTDQANAVTFQPDGRIVVAGLSQAGLTQELLVARYEGVDVVEAPEVLLEVLVSDIEDLVDIGSVNNGQGNALQKKLQTALQQLDRGNANAATNKINAFKSHVQSLVDEGVLTPSEGQSLLNSADVILQTIGV